MPAATHFMSSGGSERHVGDGVGPSGADVEQPVPAGLAVGEEEPGAVARAEVARAGELAVVAAAAEVAVDARRVGGREEERQDPGRSIHGCRHEHHEPRVAGDGHVDAVDCAGDAAENLEQHVGVEFRPWPRRSHGGRGVGSWGLWGRFGGGLRKGRRRGTPGLEDVAVVRCGAGSPTFYVLEADGQRSFFFSFFFLLRKAEEVVAQEAERRFIGPMVTGQAQYI
ncbi:hypothetical protein PVAP13_3KG484264 [Panicum virgatum]|uniref:Uncharacterized protein n=1 Tax=Panicum virgatum TaxID=38727 RepID=A0A8T0UR67_PANVG|nr:hypothetical protein PVAP13_3KG484264 [Panicum virgatum]